MAASLLIACGLNENKLPPFVHISEESNMDGGFLITSMLGQRLRASGVITHLIAFQNSYQHYVNAGMRLGYNLTLFREKKIFIFDFLNKIYQKLLDSNVVTDCDNSPQKIPGFVRRKIEEVETGKSITFIFDNLSILLNLGCSPEGLMQICHELHTIAMENPRVTMVTKLSTCDVLEVLDNNIAKLADVHLRVKQLKSGVFREVDGKLLVSRETTNGYYELAEEQKEILYKVNERSVKIFSPGEVGVKV